MLDTITQLRRRVRNKEKTRLRQLKAVCKSLDPGATGMISERSVLHRSTFPYVPRCALPLCRPRQYKAFWAQLCATSGAGKSGATHKQFLDFTMSPSLFVNSKCGGPSCRVVILCPYTPSVVSSSSQSFPHILYLCVVYELMISYVCKCKRCAWCGDVLFGRCSPFFCVLHCVVMLFCCLHCGGVEEGY